MLSVDHDHIHKHFVRGLLCSKCNRALGLSCDDESLFEGLLNYLSKHAAKPDSGKIIELPKKET